MYKQKIKIADKKWKESITTGNNRHYNFRLYKIQTMHDIIVCCHKINFGHVVQ